MLSKALATSYDDYVKFLEEQYEAEKAALLKIYEAELHRIQQSHADRVAEIGALFGFDFVVNTTAN